MSTFCLSTAYLAPVSYYSVLMAAPNVQIEQHEHYLKQTYRNRALIATANGVMPLTVPVEHPGDKVLIRDLRISDHGNWRHLHWQALQAAYDKSPFFEYYADDFRPFYEGRPTQFLLEYNLQLQQLVCDLIGLQPNVQLTEAYEKSGAFVDLRSAISPKTRPVSHDNIIRYGENSPLAFNPKPYYQVFAQRHGFLPDMSILDLLFNMGPESLIVLRDSAVSLREE